MNTKEVYRANKSGDVFYLERTTGDKVTLRNPMTGMVKEIRGTTLTRSYTKLSEEEIKMTAENTAAETVEVQNPIAFEELLECTTKAEFEKKLAAVTSPEGFEDVAAIEDYDEARKVKGNAALCFKENMDRFIKSKADYEDTTAALAENGSDLDLVKANETAKANLQKYTNKMVMYLSKAQVAAERVTALKPVPAPKAEAVEEGASEGTEE